MDRRHVLFGFAALASGPAFGRDLRLPDPVVCINGNKFWIQSSHKPHNFRQIDGQTLRFEVRPRDVWQIDQGLRKERSEICMVAHCVNGASIGFDLMVEPGPENTARWLLLGQYHQSRAAEDGSPIVALELAREEFRVVARKTPSDYMCLFRDSNFARGRWYSMKLNIRPDTRKGSLQVWRDGRQITQYEGPLGPIDPVGGYWKNGIYRAESNEPMAIQVRNLTVIV